MDDVKKPAAWVHGPFLGMDTETTGVDPLSDRIVTVSLVRRTGAGDQVGTWLLDPGVDIPAAASAVHGISTERARAEGGDYAAGLDEVAREVAAAWDAGVPLVIYNAAFDLTLLESELSRLGLPTVRDRHGSLGPVIDPLVLDRGLDRYRKGRRRLSDVAEHYGCSASGDLHDATVDIVLTLDVMQAVLAAYPNAAALELPQIMGLQTRMRHQWAKAMNDYRARNGQSADVRGGWPVL